METWFNTQARIDALVAVADSWVGTPFVANSRCKGKRGGVSCQMLAEQIYIEAGCPISFSVPAASMRWSDTHRESLIEAFLDAQPRFQTLSPDAEILPGDVIGFTVRGCVHHIGVALPRGQFIHAMRGMGVKIFNLNDPTYADRLAKIWRPKP